MRLLDSLAYLLVLTCLATSVGYAQEADTKAQKNKPTTAEQDSDAQADDSGPLAGHSYHGETFNAGPRQEAYIMGGTGDVHFPATSSVKQVQKFIDQGVGQLHGFWFLEAERSFRQAAALDPDCAIAYWGAAMANLGNSKRAKGFIAEAIERKDKASKREQAYIELLDAYLKQSNKDKRNEAYTKSLETIALEHPEDLEAKAFLVAHLYKSRSGESSYLAIDALMQQIFKVNPMHPVHHFRIHLWDYKKPELAVSSAALCGQTSPNIAHMWHMPGHIFSRLKRYEDAAWQQEASARVDHGHMMRDRLIPDQIHNFAHNNEWLIRNLIHVGRVRDSVDLAKNMTELPRHPKYNVLTKRGSSYYGRRRLFETLSTFELWDELITLSKTLYLEPTDEPKEQIQRLKYLGEAYFRSGDLENGQIQLAALNKKLEAEKAAEAKAVKKAEEKAREPKKDDKKPNEDKQVKNESAEDIEKRVKKAKADARRPHSTKIRNIEKAINALKGHAAVAANDYKTGYTLLKKAGIDKSYLAKVQWQTGEKESAIKAMQANVDANKNEVYPLAMLVDLLWQADEKEDARKALENLRKISASIDLQSPVFERITPIAKELGFPEDWRLPKQLADDIGKRPALDTLGPFRWQPSPAPSWTLQNTAETTRTSKEFHGKPVVVILYLGYGCLHCAEQLQAFGPKADEFKKAGLEIIAISTDDVDDLKMSIENYDGGPMPIPLVSDAKLTTFKAFRAYDNFEDQPLHGTFLIDKDGLVRWQDISYEPFMDPDFVLKEAQRLLSQ